MTRPRPHDGRVLVVGVGDDGPASLPPAILARVVQAELLVGGRRHLELFAEHPAERLPIAGDLTAVIDRVGAEASERRVVVLASGDPCFYGIGPLLARRLGPEVVEIVPGVNAVAFAFARLGLAWHDATVVSAHGRPLNAALQQAEQARKLAVLTDDVNTPAVVARGLLDRGADDTPCWVFEHLGGASERAVGGCLSEIAERHFASLNVVVVPELGWPPIDRRFGRSEAEFAHSRGMITKPEVRAVSLSKLALRDGDVLWDIGAGSGSLAMEAAGLMPNLSAIAIERSDEQVALLQRNLAGSRQSDRVSVVHGEAPTALIGLPTPSAVFLGGTGSQLKEILGACAEVLPPAGRIVANLVTLDRLTTMLTWARDRRFEVEVVQVSIARGVDILGMTRLDAQNPVFVVTVAR